MKDFDDFLFQLDFADIDTCLFNSKQLMNNSGRNSHDDEVFFTALELLRMYHNWLQSS